MCHRSGSSLRSAIYVTLEHEVSDCAAIWQRPKMAPINVFARWRPLSQSERGRDEIDRGTHDRSGSFFSVALERRDSVGTRPWTSPAAFRAVFESEHDNYAVFNTVVAPHIPRILRGEDCTFFAYGHSGSGKTHTIFGYDFEDPQQLGMCLGAAGEIFDKLRCLNEEERGPAMGIGFSLFELRKKYAFDLLNNRTQCHIREGPDGKVHIRGETEILEGGKVRVCPIVQLVCWDFEEFRQQLIQALEQRATGSSSIHCQSSRTHAVLQLEIVSQALVDARHDLYDRQSELVPVGRRATDIRIEEDSKSAIRTPDGQWVPNPEYQRDQGRIDAVEAEMAEFEGRVTAAEQRVHAVFKARSFPCLGAKMVFVDLAGAEYYEGNDTQLSSRNRAPQELQEGRQINGDLLALKEVMRATSQGQKRVPFRSSTLTMVLREHFLTSGKGISTIIVTLSPAAEQFAATLNSLKYASLVGAAST